MAISRGDDASLCLRTGDKEVAFWRMSFVVGNPPSHRGSQSEACGITFDMLGKGAFPGTIYNNSQSNSEKNNKANQKDLQNSEGTLETSIHGSYRAQMLLDSSVQDGFCSKLAFRLHFIHFLNCGHGFPHPPHNHSCGALTPWAWMAAN